MTDQASQGPTQYLVTHPVAYAVSLSGAGTAAGAFAIRAVRSHGPRRLGWIALSALEVFIFCGILRLRSRPRADSNAARFCG